MLRLYKSLSIEQDVFQKIPKEQLRCPATNNEEEKLLDIKSCRLALVGQESDGVMLFSHEGYSKVC